MTAPATDPIQTGRPAARNPGRLTAIALALLAVLFVAVNVLVSFTATSWRLDLTENRLYSLSPATQQVLDGIEEQIVLRLFYSQRLGAQVPAYGVYAERVRDVLQEYAGRSDGRIRLEVYDPEPFTPVEDRAVAYGLQAVPLEGIDGNVFFGLVGSNTTDDVETVPFLQPDREAFLEYDLTKMIYRLSVGDVGKVGLIGDLKLDGDIRMGQNGRPEQVPPLVVAERVKELFEIAHLQSDVQKIPDDISILLVAHPRDMPLHTQFAIDQYILAGGKAAIFVDPYAEVDGGTSTLAPMFEAWGLEMPTDKVVGDRFAGRRVGDQSGQGYVTYVPWLLLRGPNLDKTSPITGQIDSLAMATAGSLSTRDGAPVTLRPLVTSSPGSMLIEVLKVSTRQPDPQALLKEYKAEGRYTLAGLVTGTVPTGFPDGRPELDADSELDPDAVFETVRTESDGPVEVIVVADVDVLDDRFWVQFRDFFGRRIAVPAAGNGDFVANALDALTGSSELLELRGRGSSYRPFEVIEGIKREADRTYQAKERELRETLAETQRKLDALRQQDPAVQGPATLSDEEQRQVETYKRQILKLRSDLREVQASLRADVEALETRLQIVNIALMPILVAVLALVLAIWRLRRRARRSALA